MRSIILFSALFVFSISVMAAVEGLQPSKPTYDLDFLAKENFVSFSPARFPLEAPIAAGIMINGQVPTSDPRTYFSERFSADLPKLQSIKVKSTADGEVWDFPIGTRIVHEIHFNDQSNTVFEVRMIEKLTRQAWGYGTYEEKNGQLVLRSKETNPNVVNHNLISTTGEPLIVSLRQIPQAVCARCHFRTSISSEDVKEPEHIGPCEFHPGNASLKTNWAADFLQKKGWAPFVQ